MEEIAAIIVRYWWVLAVPFLLMVVVWLFRGRGLFWVFLVCLIAGAYFYFSKGSSWGIGDAIAQIGHSVVAVFRNVARSLF